MATLYELDDMFKTFEPIIDEETGEILNADEWDAINADLQVKRENTALLIKNLESDKAQHKIEKEKQAKWEKQCELKIEWLKGNLARSLNGEKFETARVKIGWRKGESVFIDDATKLDQKWYVEQQPKIDKAGIKAAIKAGEEVAGAHLEVSNNMQIK